MPVPVAGGEPGSGEREEEKNSIMMGRKDDKMCEVKETTEGEEGQVPRGGK